MEALVLEDEKRYRDHVARSLERHGLVAHAAATVSEARQIADARELDLMVVDVRLPDAIDGLEFAAQSVQDVADSPAIIVITGYPSEEYQSRSKRLGAAYLEKPFDLEDFEHHVRRAIRLRGMRREIRRLEQELSGAHAKRAEPETDGETPFACIFETGEVFHVNAAGQEVLSAIADPSLPRPVTRVDEYLLHRMKKLLKPDADWGRATVFRRDGVLGDFRMLVRPMQAGDCTAMAVFFSEGLQADRGGIDPMWLYLLFEASKHRRLGDESSPAASDD